MFVSGVDGIQQAIAPNAHGSGKYMARKALCAAEPPLPDNTWGGV